MDTAVRHTHANCMHGVQRLGAALGRGFGEARWQLVNQDGFWGLCG